MEVVLLRHAERVDETPQRAQWAQSCGDRYWDPPITQRGIEQSRAAGKALLREHRARPFACVLASPCLRTVQTAAEVAAELGLPVRCAPGLAECAAAVHQHGIKAFQPSISQEGGAAAANVQPRAKPLRRPPPRFLSEAELLPRCAPGTRFEPRDEIYEDFFTCAARLATEERARITDASAGRVLVVTHREGIRDLCDLAGQGHRRTPYCCAAMLRYEAGKGGQCAAWQLLSRPSETPGAIDPAVAVSALSTDEGAAGAEAPTHHSTDVLITDLGAGRLGPEEFSRLAQEAGMPEATAEIVLRQALLRS